MTHGAGGPRGPTRPRLVLLDPPLHGPGRPPVAVFGLPPLPGRAPRAPLPHLPDQPPRQPALADRRGRLLVGPVRRIKRQQLRRRPPRPTRGPAPHRPPRADRAAHTDPADPGTACAARPPRRRCPPTARAGPRSTGPAGAAAAAAPRSPDGCG